MPILLHKKINYNVFFIVAVLVLANLFTRGPDYLKYLSVPEGKWYTGQASWFDPWDLNVYFSAIGWGKRGGILFENVYDTTSAQKTPIFFLYTFLGKIAAVFNLSNTMTFHLSGLLFSILLAGILWWVVKLFLNEEIERKIAFIIIFFGGGLGWLFFPHLIVPDLGQPGFTLATTLRMPHEAVSLCLFLLAVGNFRQGIVSQKGKYLLLGAIFSFLNFFFHPYIVVSLAAILFGAFIYRWMKDKSIEVLKALVLLGVAGGIYYLLLGRVLLANPSFAGQVSQIQPSPSPLHVILGWGLLFPLIIITLLFKEQDKKITFLKIWFTSQYTTTYLPFSFQKLLFRGLWVPTILLAIQGMRNLCCKKNWNFQVLAGLLLVFTIFSTLYMTYKRIIESSENRWIYLTQQEGAVIEYLKAHGPDEEGVLASYRIADIIPAQTAKRVYAGHTFQSPQFEERMTETYRFFAGEMNDSEAGEFLQRAGITWVFWGPDEKVIANLVTIPNKSIFEVALEDETASLYRVLSK